LSVVSCPLSSVDGRSSGAHRRQGSVRRNGQATTDDGQRTTHRADWAIRSWAAPAWGRPWREQRRLWSSKQQPESIRKRNGYKNVIPIKDLDALYAKAARLRPKRPVPHRKAVDQRWPSARRTTRASPSNPGSSCRPGTSMGCLLESAECRNSRCRPEGWCYLRKSAEEKARLRESETREFLVRIQKLRSRRRR